MSWKEKRLITVLSIILAVLCAAVLVVLSIRYRAALAERAAVQAAEAVPQETQSGYTALEYDNGSATLSFACDENGGWYWVSEPDFPLDDSNVQSILALIGALKPQQTLDLPEDLSDYGLDVPHASLTASTADGAVLSIEMGITTTDGNSYYALINHDEALYIIADTLYLAMREPIYDMCILPELPPLAEDSLGSVLMQGPLGEPAEGEEEPSRKVTVLSAVRSEDGAVTWRSGGANVTDAADVRALLGDLEQLRVSRCVDFRPSDEAAAFCGFDDPVTLTVSYTSDSGTDESFVMYAGTQDPAGTGRYVRFGDDSAIYLMELSYLDPMMRLAYQGLEG